MLFSLRMLRRDLRAGELGLLLVALIIAVTSLTSVGFFTDRVGRAIRQQASAILAADLVIRSPAPIAAGLLDEALPHRVALLGGAEGEKTEGGVGEAVFGDRLGEGLGGDAAGG